MLDAFDETKRSAWERSLRLVRPAFVLFLLALLPIAVLEQRTSRRQVQNTGVDVSATRSDSADHQRRS